MFLSTGANENLDSSTDQLQSVKTVKCGGNCDRDGENSQTHLSMSL